MLDLSSLARDWARTRPYLAFLLPTLPLACGDANPGCHKLARHLLDNGLASLAGCVVAIEQGDDLLANRILAAHSPELNGVNRSLALQLLHFHARRIGDRNLLEWTIKAGLPPDLGYSFLGDMPENLQDAYHRMIAHLERRKSSSAPSIRKPSSKHRLPCWHTQGWWIEINARCAPDIQFFLEDLQHQMHLAPHLATETWRAVNHTAIGALYYGILNEYHEISLLAGDILARNRPPASIPFEEIERAAWGYLGALRFLDDHGAIRMDSDAPLAHALINHLILHESVQSLDMRTLLLQSRDFVQQVLDLSRYAGEPCNRATREWLDEAQNLMFGSAVAREVLGIGTMH